jgi:hypothetical protein
MATLKISDLSVGDWVYYDKGNTPYSIRSIYRTGRQDCVVLNDSVFPEGVIGFVGRLIPIHITAEMLGKNGFERSTSQFIVYHTDKVWISYDKPSETWSVTMYINDFTSNLHANILHIHQLQHALRLAGVDKEINL